MEIRPLDAKYETLASEYSKVSAKCTVLKKAVIDEQSKNADLKAQLTDTGRQLRVQKQEVEGLTFRNEQLLKRVASLQSDLGDRVDRRESSTGHSSVFSRRSSAKTGSAAAAASAAQPRLPAAADLLVLQEELQSKIDDNVRLNETLDNARAQHQAELEGLNNQLRRLRLQVQAGSLPDAPPGAVSSARSPRHDDARVSDTMSPSATQQQRNSECIECAALRRRLSDCEQRHLAALEANKRETARWRAMLQCHVPLQDAAHETLSTLNVPCADVSETARACHVAQQLASAGGQLASRLAAWHGTWRRRLLASFPHGLSTVNSQFSEALQQHTALLERVDSSVRALAAGAIAEHPLQPLCLSTIAGLDAVSQAFAAYQRHLARLDTLYRLSVQEEVPCASEHEVSCFYRVVSCFGRLSSVLNLLASASQVGDSRLNRSSAAVLLVSLADILHSLHTSLHEYCESCGWRTEGEDQSSATTLAASGELHTVQHEFSTALEKVVAAAHEVSRVWSLHSQWMCEVGTVRLRLLPPDSDRLPSPRVRHFCRRAAAFVASVNRSGTVGAGGSLALHSRSITNNTTANRCNNGGDTAELRAHVQQLEQALLSAEQTAEHCQLQLTMMKHQRERIADSSQIADETKVGAVQTNTCQPRGDASTWTGDTCHDTAAAAARERCLYKQMHEQLQCVVGRMQMAESRYRHCRLENRNTSAILDAADERCGRLQTGVDQLTEQRQLLLDEHRTASLSYETQMTAMTEHVASLNETMAAQRDNIDRLRYQLAQKERASTGKRAL